jgi:hypothetical protein
MNHFTNRRGWQGIRATSPWCFRARRQRGNNPTGAYFTTLDPSSPKFFKRTRVPRHKRPHMFCFVDIGDLVPKRGPLGRWVFYSPSDYFVAKHRQLYEGPV